MPENLMQGLLRERDRCRDLLTQYEAIGPAGAFGAVMIRQGLAQAAEAIGSGDVIGMIAAFKELEGFK